MSITITLNDELATQLKAQAAARRLSVEEYALRVLDEAGGKTPDPAWKARNQRRVALIGKQFADGLSQEEASELQQLQLLADQQLEAQDEEKLNDVRHLRDLAARMVPRA